MPGVFCDFGTSCEISSSTFYSNNASSTAIVSMQAVINSFISDCKFYNNLNKGSGIVSLMDMNFFSLNNTEFFNNHARKSGAAAYALDVSNFLIYNCSFRENRAGSGGALFLESSEVVVKDSVFISNEAFEAGGAFGAYDQSTVEFVNCSFVEHSAVSGGVACITFDSSVTFSDCHTSRSRARYNGIILCT